MKKYNAELDIRTMSAEARRYYDGSDLKVWKDGNGAFWFGIGTEENGPHTLEEIESIFEQYAAEDEALI